MSSRRPPPHDPDFPASVSPLPAWRAKAACLDEDPELFFPTGSTGPALEQIAAAKAVCQRCPVITQCLQWALKTNQDAGIWGGLTEDERRALRRKRQR
jgi:WhiB family redox-sensing transcriptional regulator